jgi:hypothetical protein
VTTTTVAVAFAAAVQLFGPAEPVEVQRPAGLGAVQPAEPAEPARPEPDPSAADPEPSEPPLDEAASEGADAGAPAEPTTLEDAPDPEPAAEAPAEPTEMLTVAGGSRQDRAPYYDASDATEFRRAHEIPEPAAPRDQARWRCLVADPTCGITFELDATSAYTHRFQQGDVRRPNAVRWPSGRAQYDLWVNVPIFVEHEGRAKYTRMTLGPKGGVIFSDGGDLWGNLGMATRYWFGRGRWAPTLEFTSALTFKIGSRETRDLGGAEPRFAMRRGPVGFAADIGFGLGGFGAIVVGGQYDSPLAREDVPEQFRVSAGGAVFVGFRGNIVWGGPAAAAILTHGLTQRYGRRP